MTSSHSQELHGSLPHMQPMSTTVNMCHRLVNLIFFLQGMHKKQTCMVGVPESSLHPIVSRVPASAHTGQAMVTPASGEPPRAGCGPTSGFICILQHVFMMRRG